jgi:hypothetical protein
VLVKLIEKKKTVRIVIIIENSEDSDNDKNSGNNNEHNKKKSSGVSHSSGSRDRVDIWICRSKIKKLNNHQKSGDLYRNVREGIF